MMDYSKFFNEIAGKLPQIKDLSMNSFEYQILALISANYPISYDELSKVCYVLVSNLFALLYIRTLDIDITKDIMREIMDSYVDDMRKAPINKEKFFEGIKEFAETHMKEKQNGN